MARIRTIKPELATSLTVASWSLLAQALWPRLFCHVDDEGRCVYDSRLLAAALAPLIGDCSAATMDDVVKEWEHSGSVQTYEVNGRSYLAVCEWDDHQRINRATDSNHPEPPETAEYETTHPDNEHSQQAHEHVSEVVHREGNREQGREQGRPTVAASGDDAPVDNGFEGFWAAYPRGAAGKPGGDGPKKTAQRAWRRLTADERTAATEAVANYAAHVDSPDGPKAAHATTWLNQERWDQWATPARASPDGPAPPDPAAVAARTARNLASLPWDDVAGRLASEGFDGHSIGRAHQAWTTAQQEPAA